ncbi:MAG: 5'/3'-nucleotidase SurE [Spirochaetales bacterium]|nr:MAG: 5'/3'-nucleotidase SurE [Spirochaetales bacterium]
MIILLTNDDGIESPGLTILRNEMEKKHRVYMSAPVRDRSGISHALSLNDPIRIRKLGDRVFSCSGYPADCVITAFLGALPEVPDCVISGINLGPNLGSDLLYSGTAAAARQASIMGKPGLAISIASFLGPYHFGAAISFLNRYFDSLLEGWKEGTFFNVNLPNTDATELKVTITSLARLEYKTSLTGFTTSGKEMYHFFNGELKNTAFPPDTDIAAVHAGHISVTAVDTYPASSGTSPEISAIFQTQG